MFTNALLSIMLFFNPVVADKAVEIDIHEAVASKLITVEPISKGGHSGDCMAVAVKSTSSTKYSIKIPAGTHFIAENDPEQDIFIVEDQVFAMTSAGEQSFSVEGFCSQHDDNSPDEGSKFKLTMSSNKKLLELADFIKGKGYSNSTKQSAVWAVSDGETIAAIFEDEKPEVKELRSYVCDITERPNPWYNTSVEHIVTESRRIETNPVLIEGKISYKIEKPGKMRMSVYKASGELIRDIFKDVAMTQAGETAINFKGKVKGWDEGGYEVKIFIDEKLIQSVPFEV